MKSVMTAAALLYTGITGPPASESWELDALPPDVITNLIETAILERIDAKKWKRAQAQEAKRQAMLARIAQRWDEVEQQFGT